MPNKRIQYLFYFLFIAFSFFGQDGKKSSVIKTINGKKFYIHTVEKNQSLYAIAKIYDIDLNNLLAENPDAIDGLKGGDELKIPVKTEAVPTVSSPNDVEKYIFHKVEKKETPYGICNKYKITEVQLKAMNPEIITGGVLILKVGQLLKVGMKQSENVSTVTTATTSIAINLADSSFVWHTVKEGETLYSLALKYGVSTESIQKLNGGLPDGLKAGQKVKVKEKNNQVTSGEIKVGNAIYLTDSTRIPTRPKKNKYNVGLFLPLQTTEVDLAGLDWMIENKKNFPNVSALTADFYEGYLNAVDSLKTADFAINTIIFDVNENDSARISSIITREDFKTLDFIIGPWYASSFRPISMAARDLGIPIVSPTIQHNKVLFQNPLASKIVPSKNFIVESLARYCADSLRTTNIVIVNNDKAKDQFAIKAFKTVYNETLKTKYNLPDTLLEVKGLAGAKAAFKSTATNIFILLTENTGYMTDFFTQLGVFTTDKKEVTVVGNYSWLNNENIDAGYFTRYNLICAAPYFIDKDEPLVNRLWKKYRFEYYSDPDELFFQSYDLSFYFLSMLKNEGPDFWMKMDKVKSPGTCMNFDFYSPNAETGFDNRGAVILKVREYKLIKGN